MHWYDREPRVVLKDTLAWDPAIDVLLHRIPAGSSRPTRRRARTSRTRSPSWPRGLDENDAFVIFPEGGNFTAAPARAGDRAAAQAGHAPDGRPRRGDDQRARTPARRLPGGAGRRTGGRRRARGAHGHGPPAHHRRRLARAADGQAAADAVVAGAALGDPRRTGRTQIEWLFGWWERIDVWIDEHRAEDLLRGAMPRGRVLDGRARLRVERLLLLGLLLDLDHVGRVVGGGRPRAAPRRRRRSPRRARRHRGRRRPRPARRPAGPSGRRSAIGSSGPTPGARCAAAAGRARRWRWWSSSCRRRRAGCTTTASCRPAWSRAACCRRSQRRPARLPKISSLRSLPPLGFCGSPLTSATLAAASSLPEAARPAALAAPAAAAVLALGMATSRVASAISDASTLVSAMSGAALSGRHPCSGRGPARAPASRPTRSPAAPRRRRRSPSRPPGRSGTSSCAACERLPVLGGCFRSCRTCPTPGERP